MYPTMAEAKKRIEMFAVALVEHIRETFGPVFEDLTRYWREFEELNRRAIVADWLDRFLPWSWALWLSDRWPLRFLPKLPPDYLQNLGGGEKPPDRL